jgi:hypothetical protein
VAYERQRVVDLLRGLGYTQAADDAARELPDPVSLEQVSKFTDRYRITIDEIMSRMGGSP